MDAIKISKESVGNINNKEDLVNLIATLGYKTDPSPLNVSEFDLPETARKLIKDLHIISDYYKKFQIYFGKTTSMRRTDFRNILEPFYRRYPQVNTLFVFTKDWQDLAFVSPLRVEIEPRKVRPRLRILFIDPANVYHTDLEVLQNIFIYPEEQNPEVIWQKHLEAFNVERVTKEFFEAYKNALRFIKDILEAQKKSTRQGAHSFAQQLLSRIMFLYFVQKKGWMKRKDYFQEKRYIKYLWESYKGSHAKKDTFYSLWLSSLFFQAFNKNHGYLTSDLPEEIKESFGLMPFLNGGLFTKNELDNIGFEVPDEVFSLLFDIDPLNRKKGFLERYNFTIREDTPLEVEVAVDPEMLGKVYESLISEEERGKSGIFYTPRVEIEYMCRLSLVEYLFEKTAILKASIIPLIFEPHTIMEYPDIESLRKIREAIEEVKVVDPAVGSASFLVGMTNVLVDIMKYLSLRIDGREENLFALKNKVLSENLYGVDVKDWAVMVGELRLWLSLIIETEEREMDIYTHPLLPNLTFKIRQGDSLIEEIAGIPISLRGRFGYIPKIIKDKIITLIDKKAAYFSGMRSADLKEKHEIEDLENEIFKDIIVNEIKRLQEEKKKIEEQLSAPRAQQIEMFGFKPDQKDLFEEETRKLKEKLPGIKKDEEHLKTLLSIIGKKSKDIGYGTALQEFLLKRMEPVYIVDNLVKRTFPESDVNTIIVLIKRPAYILKDCTTKFIAFAKPFEEVLKLEKLLSIENARERSMTDDYRVYPKSRKELLEEGVEMPEEEEIGIDPFNLKYTGNKWGGKYLRAPEIFFKILEKGKGKLVRLGDIAEVRRGFTTGANEFFYLEPTSKPAPDGLIHVRNGAGWEGFIEEEFLKPVIKSPREIKTIIVREEDLRYKVFMCHSSKEDLKKQRKTQALKYIEWGELQGYNKRPTCASRQRWWNLGEIIAPILSKRFVDDTLSYFYNPDNFFIGDTFFVIKHIKQKNINLATYLNSTICGLFTEITGRKSMGEGVLLIYGPEITGILVTKTLLIENKNSKKLFNRKILTIFEEIGLPKPKSDYSNIDPQDVSLNKVLPDRRELDRIIFEALGLTEEEQLEVYRAVVELVKNRLVKAKSV